MSQNDRSTKSSTGTMSRPLPALPPPSTRRSSDGSSQSQTRARVPPPQPAATATNNNERSSQVPTRASRDARNSSGSQQQPHRTIVVVQPSNSNSNGGFFSPVFTNSFADKQIRHAFIRKVYLILMTQLLFTVAVTVVFMTVRPVKVWVRENWWLTLIALLVYIACVIAISCFPSVGRRYPGNYICLGILTLALSFLCGCTTSFYSTQSVLIALGITVIVCVAVSIFAIQTKFDFTMCAGLLMVLTLCVLLFGFSCIIVYSVAGVNYILQCVYGAVAALLLSLYLVYDTQMVFGGRTCQLSPEDYVTGALHLYVDICMLFMILVGLSGSASSV